MPRDSRHRQQNNTLHCPQCGAENHGFASFCIACGEPFDAPSGERWNVETFERLNVVEPETQPPTPNPQSLTLRDRLARRETIIGLALLILIIGYVVFDWQRSMAQSAAFKEGVTAEQQKDWDKAASSFEQAGEQRDAKLKAGNARFQVAERDRLYSESLEATDRQDWPAVVSALEGVQAIQPSFADSAPRLVQARSQAFDVELDDLVYLVRDGPAPGLYMFDKTNGPYRLPGSDGESTLRALSPDGDRFVYDGPRGTGEGLTPSGGALPGALTDVTEKRIPVLATLEGGRIKTRPLPNLNGGGTGVFSRDGLWWYSGWYSTPTDGDYVRYEMAYGDGGADAFRTVMVTNPFSATRVLALQRGGSMLILAESRGKPRTVDRRTLIYTSNADGTNPSLIGSIEGDAQSGTISRDGRWLLVTSQFSIFRIGVEKSVWLVPLYAKGGQPRRLETVSVSGSEIPPRLVAALVPKAAPPMKVVVGRMGADADRLTLYTADDEEQTHILFSLPDDASGFDPGGFSANGRYLGLRRQSGSGATLEIVDLSGSPVPRSASLQLPFAARQPVRVSITPNDNYVLMVAQDHDGPYGDFGRRVYSARVRSDGSATSLKLIAKAYTQSDRQQPPIALLKGGALMAYVNAQQELHVTFYDGERDTKMDDGVVAVWSLDGAADAQWLR